VEKFNQLDSSLDLTPKDCLAIEDTLVGIQAAKTAGMSVVGIANTFPYHFLQRYANWAIDSFSQLDLDRVQVVLARRPNGDSNY
ncbi:MAG: HAD-IA family hydrolase, partial [Microcystaceae cyanobacterium]